MEHLPSIYDTSGSVSSNTDSGGEGRGAGERRGRRKERGSTGVLITGPNSASLSFTHFLDWTADSPSDCRDDPNQHITSPLDTGLDLSTGSRQGL